MTINNVTNNFSPNPITELENEGLEDESSFAYLGSATSTGGVSEQGTQTRIGLARSAFLSLTVLWKSKTVSLKIKLRTFQL